MRRRIALGLITIVVPVFAAVAQRGGGGGRGAGEPGRGNMGGGYADPIQFPSASNLKKFNPAERLADERKRLSLSEVQMAQLTTLGQTITKRNAELMARYDSLQRRYRPDPIPSPYGRDKDEVAQEKQLRALLDSLLARRVLDLADAIALLTDENARQQAALVFVKQEADLRALMPRSGPRDYLAPRGD